MSTLISSSSPRYRSEIQYWNVTLTMVAYLLSPCDGHGRLLDPPGRSSVWRDPRSQTDRNFKRARTNYNDNALNCGGYQIHWEVNQGKCTVCGDPWQGPYDNIPPNGKYARGIITRDYDEGDVIITRVQITADHKGYFEFKLCSNNDVTKPVTQECLDETVLTILNASREEPTRYYTHGTDYTIYELHLQLPAGVYGEQVVMQWRYHTGNSWGCDDTTCCIGCGEIQEEFYACADILIRAADFQPNTPEVTTTQSPPSAAGRACTATGQWKSVAGMDDWCKTTCVEGNVCPESHCECTDSDNDDENDDEADDEDDGTTSTGKSCVAAGPWSGNSDMDAWCAVNCPAGLCPYNTCICS